MFDFRSPGVYCQNPDADQRCGHPDEQHWRTERPGRLEVKCEAVMQNGETCWCGYELPNA